MDKLFLCKWGDWDEYAVNSYQTQSKEVTLDFFSDDNCYESGDI